MTPGTMTKNTTLAAVFLLLAGVFVEAKSAQYWGPWTAWSVCSESCGFGTAYRVRHCHTQHRSGKTCEGADKQFQICKKQDCGPDRPDYRTRECAKNNHIYYGQRRYTWVPYINEIAPCELSCKSIGFGYYARFKKTVADGVICNEENTAICMKGACVASGCDGVIGSATKVDRCGVCGGDGSSCRLLNGIFTRTHLTHRGYNIVTTIPAGACSINVTELRRSKNHLALSTPSGYLLNGDLRLQAEGEVKGAGTVFTYKRGGGQGCRGECITAPGPLNVSLRVELIYFGRNPGILYQYTVPKGSIHDVTEEQVDDDEDDRGAQTGSSRRAQFVPNYSSSRPRGGIIPRIKHGPSPRYEPDPNTSQRRRESFQIRDRRPDVQSAQTSSSPSSSSSSSIRRVKTVDYPRTIDALSSRSQLDRNGKRRPTIPRIRVRNSERRRSRYPSSQEKTRKPNRHWRVRPTEAGSRKYRRRHRTRSRNNTTSQHSGGSSTKQNPDDNQYYIPAANGSIQYQHYYHTNEHDGLEDVPVASPDTDSSREQSTASQGSDWGDNDLVNANRYAEFRSTTRYQPASREDVHSNVISSPVVPAPPVVRQGSRGRDLDNRVVPHVRSHNDIYSWRISGFTACSEPCGGGLQQTRIVCVKSDSQVEVIEENCNPSLKPRATTVICNDEPCDPAWSISPWSECSVTCGRGLQKREVECQQRLSSSLTIPVTATNCPRPRPQDRQYCQLEDCFLWKPSNWSKCSSECGFGQRSRTVQCENRQGEPVSESLCRRLRKPTLEEICDMGSCAQGWFHSKWTKECSAECGRGHYTRQVYCSAPDGSRLDESKCGGRETKPRETKSCRSERPCGGQWFAGPWSKCNSTCGDDSYRERQVLCVKRHGRRVNHVAKAHNCDKSEKPAEKEWCGKQAECQPQWYMTSWDKCSKPCGTGVRTREVKCLDTSMTSSPNCDKSRKPNRRQSCNKQACDVPVQTTTSKAPGKGVSVADKTSSPSSESKEGFQMDDQSSAVGASPDCVDKQPTNWCYAAAQARLCNYAHYSQNNCCKTCQMMKIDAAKARSSLG